MSSFHEQMSVFKDFWRIVCISDTHNLYKSIKDLPEGDILIHAGDFSNTGLWPEVEKFRQFIEQQPHKYKIFIAGNHDITIHKSFYVTDAGHKYFHGSNYRKGQGSLDGYSPEDYSDRCIDILRNGTDVYKESIPEQAERTDIVQYLEDEIYDLPGGLRVYGSPWQPAFCDWAFNVEIPNIKPYWDKIPGDVDILITHGPPHGILDANNTGFHCGCPELREQMNTQRIRPRLHIFGHIHEGYGVHEQDGIVFVNASTCTARYNPINPAIVIDLPFDRNQPARIVAVGENIDNPQKR
mmetsp:Transcript_33769/g.24805  ORF Transcript_33769/g.24805 Transcript_33769/m.24805 type:complete len:296 (+) Transcript_33769:109-996(+)